MQHISIKMPSSLQCPQSLLTTEVIMYVPPEPFEAYLAHLVLAGAAFVCSIAHEPDMPGVTS